MSDTDSGYGKLMHLVASTIEADDPDAAQALHRTADEVEGFVAELSVLRGQLAAAEVDRDDWKQRDDDRRGDVRRERLRAETAESALAAVTTGRDEARKQADRLLAFVDAVSPFVRDVLDEPFPWKTGGQVITWMSIQEYEQASSTLGALRD